MKLEVRSEKLEVNFTLHTSHFYFSSDTARQRLKAELDSWIGTPFRHMCGVKGLGCDCIHFVARIIEATVDDFPPIRIPHYSQQWHLHQGEQLLLNGILNHPRIVEVGPNIPMDGDIHLFHFGKTISHSAVYCQGQIYHAVIGTKLVAIPWNDPAWAKRRRHAFRITTKVDE